MIAYRATADVPRELVRYLGRLLAAQRRAKGTRRDTRALTCFHQALLVLVWFRKGEDVTLLGAGFGISRATAYRYLAEGVAVLAAQAQDLHAALRRVADDGWSYVILDGKLFDCDRVAETTVSVKGDTIDAWYYGKHRDFGGNVQAIMRPDGLPVWTSEAMPGHLHDLTCAQQQGITAALNWAASELDLPTLADSGYEGAGQGVKVPIKQPTGRQQLAPAENLNRSTRVTARLLATATRRWSSLGRRPPTSWSPQRTPVAGTGPRKDMPGQAPHCRPGAVSLTVFSAILVSRFQRLGSGR
ncbi:transposase family protein [Salinispora arenicola]|uniref:transposase family protein n=1 Tax=Salinispora arenicola TaxID=168697 RepID=UPI0027DE972D|nr:transposase family protein [Salinispora arenicola]